MILQVVIDRQDGDDRDRLVIHRRQKYDPMHRNGRRQQEVFWDVEGLFFQKPLKLSRELGDSERYGCHEQDSLENIDTIPKRIRSSRHRTRISCNKCDKWVGKREEEKRSIEEIVYAL